MYTISEFAKKVGVTPLTVRRHIYAGKLKPYRTPTGRYMFTDEHVKQFLGIDDSSNNTAENQCVIYCRVSTREQKDFLNNQIDACKNYALSKGYTITEIFTDTASSFNFKRKGLLKLIDYIFKHKPKYLVVYSKDRLSRLAFDVFDIVFKKLGVEIIVIDDSSQLHNDSQLKDYVEELISFIHYITSKIYGSRSYKSRKIKNCVREVIKDDISIDNKHNEEITS